MSVRGGAVIFYVEYKSLHLIRSDGSVAFFQKGRRIFGNQMQHELKSDGCAFPFDQIKQTGRIFFHCVNS